MGVLNPKVQEILFGITAVLALNLLLSILIQEGLSSSPSPSSYSTTAASASPDTTPTPTTNRRGGGGGVGVGVVEAYATVSVAPPPFAARARTAPAATHFSVRRNALRHHYFSQLRATKDKKNPSGRGGNDGGNDNDGNERAPTETTTATIPSLLQKGLEVEGYEESEQRRSEGKKTDGNAVAAAVAAEGNGGADGIATADEEDDAGWLEALQDEEYMRMAIQLAQSGGGELGASSAYPRPTVGAVLVACSDDDATDCAVLGKARSDYKTDAVRACFEDAGLDITPLSEWLVAWPTDAKLRDSLSKATLYVTLEPSHERQGTSLPPMTQLIEQAGIQRVVIGSANPVPELASKGAAALHAAGLEVTLGGILQEDCDSLIRVYGDLANSKLRRMARKHFQLFKRPLGFLHCSVVNSDNLEAFARQGNAFGTMFGGKNLSYRDFGSYEIAPPPELVWADSGSEDDFETESIPDMSFLDEVDFEDEDFQGWGEGAQGNPMMPWYEQADAIVATFPRHGNGPPEDESLTARLNGLKWLATHGEILPAGVERILVMDATDLADLPLTNDNPNLPKGVDVERFWAAQGRRPTRVLLRRGANAQAKAAADAAAVAAKAAYEAAKVAAEAIESGDAARAAEAAIEYQQAAQARTEFIQKELQAVQTLRAKLEELGVIVETIEGGEPVDVMKHLGRRNGIHAVVWRAGCWGGRGVQAIMDGAFQWVSAHLAVDAVGGKFWQLMIAENAIQAACGPVSKVKVFADQGDISLEYCDNVDADKDCSLIVDGKPIRHVRLDCRIALVDANRPREFVLLKTKKLDRKQLEEAAPWFL